jgi:HD-GYP domain-containing protein (c-di-GMP phosphodiesterase class II)
MGDELEGQGGRPIGVLARIMELRDPTSAGHARHVAELAHGVGYRMGLDGEDLARLELAASFHDIGKAAVPDRVLVKPGPLSPSEWSVMKSHAEWGGELLRYLPGCAKTAVIVRHHHERWDGNGYPDGLSEREIPRESRIIGVCEAYAAMLTDRPYRPALHAFAARAELCVAAGSQFDPDPVAALLDVALQMSQVGRCG